MQVGDITERGNQWPMLITSVHTYGTGMWIATSERVPGQQTKDQAEREEYYIRYEQRKAEQDAAYETMKQAMAAIITNNTEFASVATTVDKICELYSDYVDKWETE